MTNIKICGIRKMSDAKIALQEGAHFIGFVFVDNVTRKINESTAKQIIKEIKIAQKFDSPLKFVGLFANQQINTINHIIKECELDYVQLCGDEPPSLWKSIDAQVIKQLRIPPTGKNNIDPEMIIRSAETIFSSGSTILIDSEVKGKLGGTGIQPDWNLASKISSEYPIILAGGLTPKNISDAILSVSPWGVDVSSGVESNNQKDPRKIVEFIQNSKKSKNLSRFL
ncbi:MAG: phosphoribosylanthranilate isomerase [Dehalococcoidia bacterium]